MAKIYQLEISEYQRDMLAWILKMALTDTIIQSVLRGDNGVFESTKLDEALAMQGMLESLPEDERRHPGIVHSFCA